MKSDRILRLAMLAQLGLLAACSQKPADEAATDAPPAGAPAVEPLAETELLGLERDNVVLTLPWTDGPATHESTETTVRPSLRSVALSGGDGFDRAEFAFDEHMNLPGYRVLWNDTAVTSCRDPKSKAAHVLFVELEPAVGKDMKGPTTLTASTGMTAVDRARRLCDDDGHVVWGLEGDSAQVRVTEMRNPPRLVVDVRRGGDAAPAAGAPAGSAPAETAAPK